MRAPLPATTRKNARVVQSFAGAAPLPFCHARMGSSLSFLSFFLLSNMLSGTLEHNQP